jgi:hypothetical protein
MLNLTLCRLSHLVKWLRNFRRRLVFAVEWLLVRFFKIYLWNLDTANFPGVVSNSSGIYFDWEFQQTSNLLRFKGKLFVYECGYGF